MSRARSRRLKLPQPESAGVHELRIERLDAHELPWRAPRTPRELRDWLFERFALSFPSRAITPAHHSPFDYLAHAFFEGAFVRSGDDWIHPPDAARGGDCVVWANRGGGKTFLGAVATLLDLLFKPGVQVRVLAGSLEQSTRMHAYLQRLLDHPDLVEKIDVAITTRAVELRGGADAHVLAASETSVRGTRVQKLRCDEVDLFDPDLWHAAQLVTRSAAPIHGPWGSHIRGSVEALSTMHRPFGVMAELVDGIRGSAGRSGLKLFRWGVVDVLQVCPDPRPCEQCALLSECAGRAKAARRPPGDRGGHLSIDDAATLKTRVDKASWESEMLCLRPRRSSAVYPEFDPASHVVAADDPRLAPAIRGEVRYFAAMDFGIRGDSVVLLAGLDDAGRLIIEQEQVAPNHPVREQAATLRRWIESGCTGIPGAAPVWISIDPAGLSRSEQSGVSSAALLASAGWRIRAPRSRIETGIRLVRARLAPAAGPPRLLVHQRCRRLIDGLLRYHYPEHDPITPEPVKDGPDHVCDALRYLVLTLDRASADLRRSY